MKDIGIPSPKTLGTDLFIVILKIFQFWVVHRLHHSFSSSFQKSISQPSFEPSQKPILHNIK